MNSWLWIVIILALLVGALFWKSKNLRVRLRLPELFPKKTEDIIKDLESKAESQEERNADLKKVLEAKQKLMRAQAENTKLKNEIENLNEGNVDKPPPKVYRR